MAARIQRHTFGVVVVAYNSADLLESCVNSVRGDPDVSEIIIVDNSSEPRAKEVVTSISRLDPRVTYLDPGENLGFGAGCNRGVDHLRTRDHIVFLNPDARLEKPLTGLVRVGSTITAGWLVSEDQPDAINARDLVTPRKEFLKIFRGARSYAKVTLERARRADGAWINVGQVDGALLVISRADFESLGGFDERFELYFDDVDLCARAALEMDGCALKAERWGVHIGGESYKSSGGAAYRMARISRLRYLRKHFGATARTSATAISLAILETALRSVSRRAEGTRVRLTSLREQIRECAVAGSVQLLSRSTRPVDGSL